MFQNISKKTEEIFDEDVELNNNEKDDMKKIILKQSFSIQNCIIYILSFMMSIAGGDSNILSIAPFGFAMIASAASCGIPIIMVCFACLLGIIVKSGTSYLLTYILTILVFFASILIKKPNISLFEINDAYGKKRVGVHIAVAVFLVQIVQMLFTKFYVYDFLYSIMISLLTLVLYKIFSHSIIVFKELGKTKVFSMEEILGASIMLIIAISSLGNVSVFGFSIRNILSILIVLILGWKNGMLIGATGGITIGLSLGIIQGESVAFIAAYAISGMIAGLLNRLGKVGVIFGFIIGNIALAYISNGNTIQIIRFQEILIAALGLLALPKSVGLKASDLIEKNKLLPETTERTLEENRDTINKLNNMSDTILQIAKEYECAAATVVADEDVEKNEELNESIFKNELYINLEGQEENLLYDDIYNNEENLITEIFEILLNNEVITKKNLIELFANHNNYIMGCSENKDDKDYTVKEDIEDMIRIINSSYRLSKINFIWQKKINENKKNVSTQLNGVSEAISDLAEQITVPENDLFKNQKSEIKILLEEKEITLKDINIKQEETGRYIVTLYTNVCESTDGKKCYSKNIIKILNKVFNGKMILQTQRCGLRENDNTCMFTFTSDDNYTMQVGVAKSKKVGSVISGDTTIQTRLEDGKFLLAISDGMGSGPEARKSSKIAIKMLERLLSTGFNKDTALKLINSIISNNTEDDMYATLDVNILDMYSGNMEFFKNGACPTFLKRKNNVDILKSLSLPTGILNNIDLVEYNQELQDGDIIVMCSDGIIDSSKEFTNKELWIKYLLEELETDDAQRISDIILNEARDNDFGQEKDDMTVIACKISQKNK